MVYLPIEMIKTFLIYCLIEIFLAQKDIQFKVDSSNITFHANWHPNVRELSQQISIFNQHLLRDDLQAIDISFSYCSDHQYLLQNLFVSNFRARFISINLDSCKIGNEGLALILSKIEGGHPQALKLVLNSIEISDQILDNLGKSVSELPLKSLEIELVYNKLTGKGLNSLFLHPLRNELESLSLDFVFNKLDSKSLSNLTFFLENVQSDRLKKLALNLGSNKIDEKGSQQLYESLNRFQNLEQLKLDMYFNNIRIKGAKHISQFVKLQQNLKSLSLNFDLNYIETQGGIAIGSAIRNLPSLQQLEIDVSNKNFGFNGFQAIVAQVGGLGKLKSLTLRAGVNRVGLKGAQKFSQAISKLNLEYLDLGFTENFITDEGIQVISQAISKQKSIKSIKLNLGFNEARGFGPISLFKILESNRYNDVWLGLSNNPLEDKEVKLIIPLLQSMIRNTQRFELEFLNTKISEQLASQIREIFDKASKNKCDAIVHIDSIEAGQRIRNELEKQNQEAQPSDSNQSQL